MFTKTDPESIKTAFRDIYSRKPVLSNFFSQGMPDTEMYKTDKSLIIRKAEDDFYRVYLMTLDKNEISGILRDLKGTNVINIPTKEEIEEWAPLLDKCGFRQIGLYQRFSNSSVRYRGAFTARYADIAHFESLKNMMYKNFDKYTDHLPNDSELATMIADKRVIIHQENGKLEGLFIHTFEGKKCYFNCWYDESNNGLYLLFNMYSLMREKNILHSYFWVNSENTKVKQIHTLLGSKPDGLLDYIFMKNGI